MLSQEQRQAMLVTRKEHLSKLRPILRDRAELHRLVAACGAESTPFNQRSESNFKVAVQLKIHWEVCVIKLRPCAFTCVTSQALAEDCYGLPFDWQQLQPSTYLNGLLVPLPLTKLWSSCAGDRCAPCDVV